MGPPAPAPRLRRREGRKLDERFVASSSSSLTRRRKLFGIPMGGRRPGWKSESLSVEDTSDESALRSDKDRERDDMRGSRFIHDGPSSFVEYERVMVSVLIRFPSVKTAMDEPWTTMDEITRKVVMGQMSCTM